MKTIFLIIFFCIVLSPQLFAQISTPSLDTTKKSDLAAAASWRFHSSLAIGYRSGSGKIKSSDTTVAEFDQTYTEAILAHQLNGLTFEYGVNPEFKRNTEIIVSSEKQVTETEQTQFNLAYRVNQNISIGASSRTWKFDDNTDTASAGLKNETGIGEESGIGMGLSLRLLDIIFIAFGVEDLEQQVDGYQDNEWQDQYQGISILTDGGIRLEWSKIESPESEKTGAVYHNQSTDTKVTVEYLLDVWLLSYQTQSYVIKPQNGGRDIEYSYITYGFGMTADQGLSFNISMTDGTESEEEYEIKVYRIGLAYNY
ncbi:MAG: hypothetical protein HOG71_03880 [Bacteroidetes bacterium]|nr:hypothetical protein [Bacteroidota bacterium]